MWLAISPANALAPPPATTSTVAPVVKSATNVARSDTSPVTAPKVADMVVATAVATAAVVAVTADASRPAIRVVDSAIWPVTALRVKNATTVSLLIVDWLEFVSELTPS